MLLLLTNTILLGPPSLKDPASNRSRRKNFCHKPEFSTHICCHMRRRSFSTLTPANKQEGDRKILMANFPSCIIDINYYHWPWDHYYVNLRKNYLASIKKLKEVDLSLLEPAGQCEGWWAQWAPGGGGAAQGHQGKVGKVDGQSCTMCNKKVL